MAVEHGSIGRGTLDTVGSTSLLACVAPATIGCVWGIALTFDDGVSTLQHSAKAVRVGVG